MKILYIANIRIPTEKAHGVQIAEMCGAFANTGIEVELVVPKRRNHLTQDAFAYYGLTKNFSITRLFSWDLVRFGTLGFLVQSLTFALSALFYVRKSDAIIYSRDDFFLFLLSFTGRRYVYEVHAPKWHFVTRRALANATLIVPISNGLKDFYIRKGISETRLCLAPDAVNVKRFMIPDTREACRKKLHLPLDKKIALYSGHLYERKGAHVFAEAAKLLKEEVLSIFVGGTEVDIVAFKKKYGGVKNILILGHQSYQDIPYYLRAADVLVLPNSAKDEDSRLYTSPMKLFEYMASGTPIVASDVPSLKEVLNEELSSFFSPDFSESLAESIQKSLVSHGSQTVSNKNIEKYSWSTRAQNILEHILLFAQ